MRHSLADRCICSQKKHAPLNRQQEFTFYHCMLASVQLYVAKHHFGLFLWPILQSCTHFPGK